MSIVVCYCGPIDEGEKVLHPQGRSIRQVDWIQPLPYAALQSANDERFPTGRLHYWKSGWLRDLTDGAIETLAIPSSHALLRQQRRPTADARSGEPYRPSATAFPHRAEHYDFLILSQWSDPTDSDRNVEWTKALFQAMQPHLEESVYVNNLGDEGPERVQAAYGDNYSRLADLKGTYDPDNLFRANQNIDPTPERGSGPTCSVDASSECRPEKRSGAETDMNASAPITRGLGISAGLEAGLARDLAVRCERLGYHSLWSNDEPTHSGLEMLALFAAAAPRSSWALGYFRSTDTNRSRSQPRSLVTGWIHRGSGSGSGLANCARRSTSCGGPLPSYESCFRTGRASLWRPCDRRCAALVAQSPTVCCSTGCCPLKRRWRVNGCWKERTRWDVPRWSRRTCALLWALVRRSGSATRRASTAASMKPIAGTSRPWMFRSAASVWPHRHDQRCSKDWRRTTLRSIFRSRGCSQHRMRHRCAPLHSQQRREWPPNDADRTITACLETILAASR